MSGRQLTAVEKKRQGQVVTIRKMLEKSTGQIKLSLPSHMDVEKLIRIAQTATYKTPKLLECTPESFVVALLNAGQCGLEPDGRRGYLIPYWNRQRGVMEAQFQSSYQGLCDLAYRTGMVESIVGRAVCEHDYFEFEYGLEEKLIHKPILTSERGRLVAAYAVAKIKDGGKVFVVLGPEEIEKRRRSSRSSDGADSPWNQWAEAMWAKSAVRALSSFLPQSTEYVRTLHSDDYSDTGVSQGDIIDAEMISDIVGYQEEDATATLEGNGKEVPPAAEPTEEDLKRQVEELNAILDAQPNKDDAKEPPKRTTKKTRSQQAADQME